MVECRVHIVNIPSCTQTPSTCGHMLMMCHKIVVHTNDGRDQDFEFETETETFILALVEFETGTFILRLVGLKPRPRLSIWVTLNRDRNQDFPFVSREIETETKTFQVSWNQRQSRKHPVFLQAQTNKCFLSKRTREPVHYLKNTSYYHFLIPAHNNHNCQDQTLSLDNLEPPPTMQ